MDLPDHVSTRIDPDLLSQFEIPMHASRHPIICLEFNELVPSLMDRFIGEGALPNFERLRETSDVFTTDTIDHSTEALEPWVQYCSAHTGVRAQVHGVMNLANGHKYSGPRFWDVADQAGLSVMLWSSMNIHTRPGFRGTVLPDPWAAGSISFSPPDLAPFVNYVQKSVQEHTRTDSSSDKAELRAFVWFLLRHGIKFSTIRTLIAQLISERGRGHRFRRAFVLDRIISDIFCSYYRRQKPDLATLFLNSTAFVQHRYWRNFEPEHFELKPTEADQARFGGAIREGYRNMDQIVGQVRALNPQARLLLYTAHSQQPHVLHERQGGKSCYRPRDFGATLTSLGIQSIEQVEPVMTEQFRIHFPSSDSRDVALGQLLSWVYEGKRVFNFKPDSEKTLFGGCRLHDCLPKEAAIDAPDGTQLKFYDLFYLIDAVKSGRHHPDGILWIQNDAGVKHVHSGRVPVTAIAATILQLLEVPVPEEIAEPGLLVS